MNIFLGISASQGISLGTAFVIPEQIQRVIPHSTIDSTEDEWNRFLSAKEKIFSEIQQKLSLISSTEKTDKIQRDLFETYLLMLEDPVFIKELKTQLELDSVNIEHILNTKTEEYADRLRNSGNDYLTERAIDITDIFGRVLDELLGVEHFNIEEIPDGAVIIAKSINPSDTMILSKKKIAGIALVEGGISSHVAILARSYDIPAVFGLEKVTKEIQTGAQLIVDGTAGEIIINPDEQTLNDYTIKIQNEKKHKEQIIQFRTKPAQTKDGTPFKLFANIGTPEEAKIAMEEGADGIGLFRTEFLFMADSSKGMHTRSMSEEEQFLAYKEVLETMKGKPVTIRTLDAGGDKIISATDLPYEIENNPMMGLRAIRLSLQFPQILKTQLRALYRASVYGNLKIMLPLITTIEQVVKSKEIALQVQEELESENIPFKKDVPIGIMIETAAAGITADCLAKVSDFFSIGTNDLTQYTLGVDRENLNVAPLYNELHLSVLRLIQFTIDAAKKENIPISVCGEMASKSDTAMILAGMGIRNLSMGARRISCIKEVLANISIKELQAISSKSLNNL